MSVSVQQLYQACCWVLMEDNGLVCGVYTAAQFLEALGVVLLDFSQKAPLDKLIFTQMVQAGVSDYIVPDDVMVPQLCFIGGRIIERVTEADLTQGHFEWKRQWAVPQQWHEDNLEVKHLEVFPKPDYNGENIAGTGPPYGKYGDFYPTERNLTTVGPGAPSKTTWVMGDTIDGVPDSFVPYIAYGILAQIFSSDSELADPQRALYCKTRYAEGVGLARVIGREELLDEDD